ncbi:MAG: hypothetical protein HY821_17845 [Acidobacteria bacterium]|nr:hypothetical protein [Acidobacteriota bacterium]
MDSFGARYLSGVQGRWTTSDGSEKPEPVPYEVFSDPQTLNPHVYVRGNPVGNRDLDGTWIGRKGCAMDSMRMVGG